MENSVICKLETKIPKNMILGNAAKHAKFIKFSRIIVTTLEIDPGNFRSISQRLAILQNNLGNAGKSWSVKYYCL